MNVSSVTGAQADKQLVKGRGDCLWVLSSYKVLKEVYVSQLVADEKRRFLLFFC